MMFEWFLTYVHANKLDAESLTKHIIDTCTFHQLDPIQIVSQGYDSATFVRAHFMIDLLFKVKHGKFVACILSDWCN